jgi:triosephosphate isomerase (TIM)
MSVLIAGNWKMHKGPGETAAFCVGLLEALGDVGDVGDVEVVVAPTFVSIHAAVEELQDSGIRVYAQNVHWAEEGAYTGEVSRSMLIASGVAGAIVGHSERRQYFGETDESTAQRAAAALEAGLGVIACVG